MIEVVLPWPAREVWPNYRQSHHWSSFTKARKVQRQEAAVLVRVVSGDSPSRAAIAQQPRIPMSVEFYPPDRRNRDDDGCIGAFKSARDGIADALGVDDKRFKPSYHFMGPAKPGMIVVRIGGPE